MRSTSVLLLVVLAACRGEPVPRDYQNHPPAMMHPADSSAQAPSQHGMPGAAPEPSHGAEGKTIGTVEPVVPSTGTSTTDGRPVETPPPSGTQNPEGGAPERSATQPPRR